MHHLECKHKVTVIGRLNRQDGQPCFDRRFNGVGRYARFADCDITELSKNSAVTGCSLLPAWRAPTVCPAQARFPFRNIKPRGSVLVSTPKTLRQAPVGLPFNGHFNCRSHFPARFAGARVSASTLACQGRKWHNLEFEYPASDKPAMDEFVTRASYALRAYNIEPAARFTAGSAPQV